MSSKIIILAAIVIIVILGGWFFFRGSEAPKETSVAPQNDVLATSSNNKNPMVTLQTNKGDIKIELFLDKAPITAGNFLKLAKSGFYDNTKFHRVIAGFMIQGGDPNSKGSDASLYGRGGPGYAIKDEFALGLSNARGTISMANSGPNTGGSQFFINLVANTFLDGKHPVFGNVISGMDVVDAIAASKTGPGDLPLAPVIIKSISVSE